VGSGGVHGPNMGRSHGSQRSNGGSKHFAGGVEVLCSKYPVMESSRQSSVRPCMFQACPLQIVHGEELVGSICSCEVYTNFATEVGKRIKGQ
jgi:hypothetical protein